MSTNQFIIEI